MKFLLSLFTFTFCLISSAAEKPSFQEFVLGKWKMNIEAGLKEQEKNIPGGISEELREQVIQNLSNTKVTITKTQLIILTDTKEIKLDYKTIEVGPNSLKIRVHYQLGGIEDRILTYENDSLVIREGDRTLMFLSKMNEE